MLLEKKKRLVWKESYVRAIQEWLDAMHYVWRCCEETKGEDKPKESQTKWLRKEALAEGVPDQARATPHPPWSTRHNLAMGVTLFPCSTPNVTVPLGSTSDIVPPPYFASEVASYFNLS